MEGKVINMSSVKTTIIGVCPVIYENGKFLLTDRFDIGDDPRDQYLKGCWQIPGGGIEFGESPEECAIRETKEELGIDVKINKLLLVYNKFNAERGWHGVFILYLVDRIDKNAEIKVDGVESSKYGWFTLDEARKLLLLPATLPALEEIQKQLN